MWEGRRGNGFVGGALCAATPELFASGGFYLFSGRFADVSLVGFGHSLVSYLPGTLVALFAYVGMAAIVHLSLVSRTAAGRVGAGPVSR